jgi:DNA-binding protein HU-beta
MNKADVIEKISKQSDLSKAHAGKVLDTMLNTITGALKKNDSVTLVGFGTFKVAQRKARVGINPKTGAKIQIKARKVPRFTAGKALKTAIK